MEDYRRYLRIFNIWDKNKDACKINLILCGPIYSLMNKIFQSSKEPLFGRTTVLIFKLSY